ncbi:MAG: ParB/RepB/Spo0J family partition protein [Clostridia bacterium]|nr:ParB/RepB/Spo0J family partition protein [Clostridia bacterium]
MPRKVHGLGRGLDALLPQDASAGAAVTEIAIGELDPNPQQPRRDFSEERISELAQSIRDQGVLQPILVRHTGGGRYRIVAGERRWRAAREAGLETVPCLIRELDDAQEKEIALIENLQREDLNPLEAAEGIRALMDDGGYTQEMASKRLGMSRPAVANLLRLLALPEEIRNLIRDGQLSAGHGRALAGIEDPEAQLALAREAAEKGYSVREVEQLAAGRKAPAERRGPIRRVLTAELSELEDRLREATGMRAVLTGSEKKGRIVLTYYSREELDQLCELMNRLAEG